MPHPLVNPIYNSLSTNHLEFGKGTNNVKYYQRDIAAFAGMEIYDEKSFETLYQQEPNLFVLFSPQQLNIPSKFILKNKILLSQFVYEQGNLPFGDNDLTITDLNEEHVQEIITLVNLTQPGPFLENTIALGNYTGIFADDKLVSMAGHRFYPNNFIEVSAVCCHPEYLGRRYPYHLIREQIRRILEKKCTPFLHVKSDNESAISLYKKLGFKVRSEMTAFVINKI